MGGTYGHNVSQIQTDMGCGSTVTYRISCESDKGHCKGNWVGLIIWQMYGDFKPKFRGGIKKGQRVTAPYVFFISTNNWRYQAAKKEKNVAGMVHGYALFVLSGEKNFENIVCTGFAVRPHSKIEYISGAANTKGIYSDGKPIATSVEQKIIKELVLNWISYGPGQDVKLMRNGDRPVKIKRNQNQKPARVINCVRKIKRNQI